MSWLKYLGKRRPSSLSDQASYDEQVSRPKAKEVKHDNPKGVDGTSLSPEGRKKKKSK